MIFNFLKIAFRNFGKQKLYHSINFTGLTIGLTCCALVLLYVKHEFSYDNFHVDSNNTYRLIGKRVYGPYFPSLENQYANELMKHPLPGMEKRVRISRTPMKYSKVGNQKFAAPNALMLEAKSEFFEIFDYPVLKGNKETFLDEPNSAILTASTAQKYFPGQEAMNQTFKYDSLLVKVTGVIADLPSNTHLKFNLLVVHPTYMKRERGGAIFYTRLNENTNPDELANKVADFNLGLNEWDSLAAVKAQPIESIHLNSNLTFELKPGGDKQQVLMFSLIALIILVISATNYTNLSSALYAKRSTEIAIRKVLGSSKSQLSIQFLFESMLVACLCLPFVILLVESILPFFNNFIGIKLSNEFVSNPSYTLLLIGIAVVTGTFAGLYPSMILPQLKILNLFRKESQSHRGGLQLRRVLITAQFTLLIALGATAFFTNKQLQYLSQRDLGFDSESVIKLKQAWGLEGADNIKNFKNRLLENPNIFTVSQGYVPGDEDYKMNYKPEESEVILNDALQGGVDHSYFEALSIEGISGPYFSEKPQEHPRTSLLINEALAEKMSWDDPIGKRISINPDSPEIKYYEVRGVFKDYNFYSLHQGVTPMMLFAREGRRYVNQNIILKINLKKSEEVFEHVSSVWDEYQPNSPLVMEFMDRDIQEAYANDANTAKLSMILSSLAIALAVLGLVGLTAYIAELRTKEIGIRKVLGAPLYKVLMIFNVEFIPALAIATVIAGVIGYFSVSSWLGNFAYRINVDIPVFLAAGVIVLLITFLTVSIQSIKTAMQNPVKSLRHE